MNIVVLHEYLFFKSLIWSIFMIIWSYILLKNRNAEIWLYFLILNRSYIWRQNIEEKMRVAVTLFVVTCATGFLASADIVVPSKSVIYI